MKSNVQKEVLPSQQVGSAGIGAASAHVASAHVECPLVMSSSAAHGMPSFPGRLGDSGITGVNETIHNLITIDDDDNQQLMDAKHSDHIDLSPAQADQLLHQTDTLPKTMYAVAEELLTTSDSDEEAPEKLPTETAADYHKRRTQHGVQQCKKHEKLDLQRSLIEKILLKLRN